MEGVENLPAEVVVEVVYSGVLVMGCGVRLSKALSLSCCSVDGYKIECVYSPHRFSIVTRQLNNSMVSTSTEVSTK